MAVIQGGIMWKSIFIFIFVLMGLFIGVYGALLLPLLFVACTVLMLIPLSFWALEQLTLYFFEILTTFFKRLSFESNISKLNEAGTVSLGNKIYNVLIIDDDLDSANIVAREYKKFGLNVSISVDYKNAIKKIIKNRYDLVVLDWLLDEGHMGDEILKYADNHLTLEQRQNRESKTNHTKIISFSAFDRSFIRVPLLNYFMYHDHWQKPLMPIELRSKINQQLLTQG